MNLQIVRILISKDLRLSFRNRLFAVLTPLGFAFYLAAYFLMPGTVDERLEIALYAPAVPPALEEMHDEGLELRMVESEAALREAVAGGGYLAGVALPADLMAAPTAGPPPRVTLYFAAGTPGEMKDAVELLVRELVYLQAGRPLPITVSGEILGPDMLGAQIPPRDRLRPLLAIFILLVETMALATLIGEEVGRRTVRALLVTPMTVKELFAAKGIVGVGMAFGQAALFMAIVSGLGREPAVILTALLLGAVLVTGIGFLVGSAARDMLEAMPWLVIVFFPLMIPAIGIVFPGAITSEWVKAIPSYYLVDTVHRAANFGSGFGDLWQNLAMLLAFDLAFLWLGITALRRRFV
jgi:ABC-2 type transport system permease protein